MFDTFSGHAGRARAARAGLAVVLAISAAGVAACGSSDGDQPGDAPARAGTAAIDHEPAARSGSDKDQIRQLLKDLQNDFVAGDAASYCSNLTATGRDQIADIAKDFGHGSTCQEFIATTSKMTRSSGVKQRPTVLLSVRVQGDRAVAKVSDGGRPATSVEFVKRDGEWKVPDPGIKATLYGGQGQKPPPPPAPRTGT